jgi:hypothetical protein
LCLHLLLLLLLLLQLRLQGLAIAGGRCITHTSEGQADATPGRHHLRTTPRLR